MYELNKYNYVTMLRKNLLVDSQNLEENVSLIRIPTWVVKTTDIYGHYSLPEKRLKRSGPHM
jgi:hypothetical protein